MSRTILVVLGGLIAGVAAHITWFDTHFAVPCWFVKRWLFGQYTGYVGICTGGCAPYVKPVTAAMRN